MMELIKSHWLRTWARKGRLFLMLILLLAALVLALFMSDRSQFSCNLAVVGDYPTEIRNESIQVTPLDQPPKKSALILGTYDAVVDFSGKETKITTFKNEQFKKSVAFFLAGKSPEKLQVSNQASKGKRVFSYMLMFLLMMGVTNTFLYSEDKEKHLFERLLCSGVSMSKLLVSYALFVFGLLFLSTFSLFVIFDQLLNIDLGLPLEDYAGLLALLCLVAVSFALCNASFFKEGDQANMIGSMIVVITSLLSGSFFSLDHNSGWWKMLTNWLPQKQFLTMVESVAGGKGFTLPLVSSLLVISAILFVLALLKNRESYLR